MWVLLSALGLIIPRVVAILLFLFTDWFQAAFDSAILPVLAFIFLPYTLLWVSAVNNWYGGEWGLWQIIVTVIAVILDLSPASKLRS